MRLLQILICFVFCSRAYSQGIVNNYRSFVNAYTAKNYKACVDKGDSLLAEIYHPNVLYKLAECYCRLGENEKSIHYLEVLAKLGLPYMVETNDNLENLNKVKEFDAVRTRFTANRSAVDNSYIAFVVRDSSLIPEGIASVRSGHKFFIGSLAKSKIVTFSLEGSEEDFISSNQHGIWSVVGMKVSPDNKSLWVCSATERDTLNGYSAIFQFEIKKGRLIRKYVVNNNDGDHFFNDLVVTRDNRVFFTDSKAGKVCLISSNGVTDFTTGLIYPNGIAIDEKRGLLLAADFQGLHKIDLTTGKQLLIDPQGLTYLNGIDGLYLHKGYAIAIQDSGNNDDRVMKFTLDKSATKLMKAETLQSFRPDFIIPTTGTIIGDAFFFIANSQLRNLRPDGSLVSPEKLKNPIILKIDLSRFD